MRNALTKKEFLVHLVDRREQVFIPNQIELEVKTSCVQYNQPVRETEQLKEQSIDRIVTKLGNLDFLSFIFSV